VRVVSLIASSPEIVCALGFEDALVGRSHECDFPPSVRRLPACTEPKFPTDGTSYQIDERVRAIVQEGLSVYRVHADALDRLRPDLIITQSQCEVCAVSLRDVEEAVCRLVASQPRIVSLEPDTLADVMDDVRRVADALGAPARGEELVAALRARLDALAGRTRDLARPTVAVVEWIEPLMSGGNWMPELVVLAGGENLFGQAGRHSPMLAWEDLVARDPEVIVVTPCGWDVPKARSEMGPLVTRPEWPGLRAVRAGRVYLADGNQYYNRPGPRLVDSAELLAEMLHPETFGTASHGRGWERL
jgi:iron complex transport system substrate-binding protein